MRACALHARYCRGHEWDDWIPLFIVLRRACYFLAIHLPPTISQNLRNLQNPLFARVYLGKSDFRIATWHEKREERDKKKEESIECQNLTQDGPF